MESTMESPLEFLSNCWTPSTYLSSRFFYAYGNTPMEDFLQDFLLPEDEVDVLFLGAGDIRHTLKTIAGLACRPTSVALPKSIHFNLVDVDKDVMARDIVLLEIIHRMDGKKVDDLDFLWEIWFNLSLEESHYRRLVGIIKEILEGKLSSSAIWKYGNDSSKDFVTGTLRAWLGATPWNKEKVFESRRKAIKHFRKFDINDPEDVIMLTKLTPLTFYTDAYSSTLSDDLSPKEKIFVSEIRESIATGNLRRPGKIDNGPENSYVNPTLMRPNSKEWHVHYNSHPMHCFLPMEKSFIHKFDSLYDAGISALSNVLKLYKCSLNKLKIKVSVVMWVDDVFHFLHHQLRPDASFDFIHTSNLPDHLGLLNLLVSCAPRLKNYRSVLVTETFKWSVLFQDLHTFVEANVECDPKLLPSVLGIHLAEDFDLGTNTLHSISMFRSTKPESLCWVKNHGTSNMLVSLKDSPDIQHFLERQVTNCCKPMELYYGIDGSFMYTPLTLFHILLGLQYRITGGMAELLQFVDRVFDSRKDSFRYETSWKALCRSFGMGNSHDELIAVKFRFGHEFPKEDNPEAIGFSCPTSLSIRDVQLGADLTCFNVEEYYKNADIIRNFWFDQQQHTYTILTLKSSWESLSDLGFIFLLMADGRLVDSSRMLNVKKDVKNIFTFKTEEHIQTPPHQLIHTSVVCKEFNDRYELEMRINNEGGKVNCTSEYFSPIRGLHPKTGLKVSVKCASRANDESSFIFACALNVDNCKLSVSSKNGTIKSFLSKDGWNVGRLLLPLRAIDESDLIPFGSAKEIVDYLTDRNLLNLMFKSLTDVELDTGFRKSGSEVQDPFFCLRATICDIWRKVETNPEITTFTFRYKEGNHPSGINGKIDLIVRGYFLYRGMPFLKVTFIDTEKALQLVYEHKLLFLVMRAKRLEAMGFNPWTSEFDQTKSQIVTMNAEEHKLTKKMLLMNSCRIKQGCGGDNDNSGWFCETFLQMLFRREAREGSEFNWTDHMPAHVGDARNGGICPTPGPSCSCQICGKTGLELKKCGRCKSVSYCGKECQIQDWKHHKKDCSEEPSRGGTTVKNTTPAGPAQPDQEVPPSCGFCGNQKGQLLKCTKCTMSFYCNAECRKKDSKSHKNVCEERVKWRIAINRV